MSRNNKPTYNKKLHCDEIYDPNNFKKYTLESHGNYMYIDYTNIGGIKSNRELLQSEFRDTVLRIFLSYSEKGKNIYKIAFLYLNDLRNGVPRHEYKPARNIYLLDVSNKEDKYMNSHVFDHVVKSMTNYNEHLINTEQNIYNKKKEKEHSYVSYGRNVLHLSKSLLQKVKPKNIMCLTAKNIKGIVGKARRRTRKTKNNGIAKTKKRSS